MGGKSSSSTSTTSQAFDNRVLNQNRTEIDARQDIDNSVEFDQEIDNSNELGAGAIQTEGDVTVNTLDGGAIEDAFDFAQTVAGDSLTASSEALSQAFSSTAGGVIEAGRDFVKFGGIGIAALIIFLAFMNRKK